MPDLATLTLVWLAAQKPDAAATAALDGWARAHSARLEEPRRDAFGEGEAASQALAERCEGWLEQARDQLQAGDDRAAHGTVAQVDQNLRQHPELLQASWLMAERYRLQARIARRSIPGEALSWEKLADVLEGTRAPAFGEGDGALRGSVAKVRIELVVHAARRHAIYWDGSPAHDDVSLAAGEHQLLVFRGSRVAWAGWVSALAPAKVDIWVPDAPACSAEDFEGVALEAGSRVSVPRGVRCASWAAVAPGSLSGALSIALCRGDRCQPSATTLVLETETPGAPATSAEPAATKGILPAWAAWTLAGVGVAAATSIVLWRAGVFAPAPESKVIYDGSNL